MQNKRHRSINDPIIPDNSDYYGKWIGLKDFNDNTVMAYGETIERLEESAKNVGCKITGHVGDIDRPLVVIYCHTPCESQCGITTLVDIQIWEECKKDGLKCPKCKYLK